MARRAVAIKKSRFIPVRLPTHSERVFFEKNLFVAGMASVDRSVVMSPFSRLTYRQRQAVILNEAARLVMADDISLRPAFDLTLEQRRVFATYGPIQAIRETIAARILSRDSSALVPSREQLHFVRALSRAMRRTKINRRTIARRN